MPGAVALLALAIGAQAVPPPATAAPPVIQSASPRTLIGRFSCGTMIHEVQVTAAPLAGTGATLDRVTSGGRPVDAGSLAEARRMVARMTDVQSLDVRCRGEEGSLSIYGMQAPAGAVPRRARLRATLHEERIDALSIGFEQR